MRRIRRLTGDDGRWISAERRLFDQPVKVPTKNLDDGIWERANALLAEPG